MSDAGRELIMIAMLPHFALEVFDVGRAIAVTGTPWHEHVAGHRERVAEHRRCESALVLERRHALSHPLCLPSKCRH